MGPAGAGGADAGDTPGSPGDLAEHTPQGRLRAYLIRLLGTRRVRVDAEGPEGEIAVIRVPEGAVPALLEHERRGRVVDRAREEGFRHAALSLEPSEEAVELLPEADLPSEPLPEVPPLPDSTAGS